MSAIVGPNNDQFYFLLTNGVERVSFIKLAAPPFAPLNQGVLYELADGKLYYNGNEILTAISPGTVQGPVSSTPNALVRWNNTLGTLVADSTVLLGNTGVISEVSGVVFRKEDDNPGNNETLWVDANSKLHYGPIGLSPSAGVAYYLDLAVGTDIVLPAGIVTPLAVPTAVSNAWGYSNGGPGVLIYTALGGVVRMSFCISYTPTQLVDPSYYTFFIYINGVQAVTGASKIIAFNGITVTCVLALQEFVVQSSTIDVRVSSSLDSSINVQSFNLNCMGLVA
jgi:hypothetical protein